MATSSIHGPPVVASLWHVPSFRNYGKKQQKKKRRTKEMVGRKKVEERERERTNE